MKFEQLEARVHLNVITWTYSRQTGLVSFAQRQEDEIGVPVSFFITEIVQKEAPSRYIAESKKIQETVAWGPSL